MHSGRLRAAMTHQPSSVPNVAELTDLGMRWVARYPELAEVLRPPHQRDEFVERRVSRALKARGSRLDLSAVGILATALQASRPGAWELKKRVRAKRMTARMKRLRTEWPKDVKRFLDKYPLPAVLEHDICTFLSTWLSSISRDRQARRGSPPNEIVRDAVLKLKRECGLSEATIAAALIAVKLVRSNNAVAVERSVRRYLRQTTKEVRDVT